VTRCGQGGSRPEREQSTWRSSTARPALSGLREGGPGVVDLAIVDGKIVEINLIADPERIDQSDIVLLDNWSRWSSNRG